MRTNALTAPSSSTPNPWAALPVLLIGAFMVVLDFFIVNVALPSVATDLHAGDSALEWIVAGYGLTFAAILLPLIEGRELGWPAWTWISLALAPAILAGFVARQRQLSRRGDDPLLDLALFPERGFSAGLATQVCLASAQASFFVFLALYLQLGRGLGPLESGLVFTILAGAYVAASGPAPALTARLGRSVVAFGGVSLTLGLGLLALVVSEVGTGGSLLALVPGLALVGAGIGLCFTPLTSIVLAGIEPSRAGSASGAMSTTQQVGYALGVAITGVIFFGAADEGIGRAFEVALIQLSVCSAGIVVMSRLLPGRAGGTAEALAPAAATAR